MQDTQPPADGRIFVMDIGTRSVVGIVGHRQGDLFVVDAFETEPHPRRAMIDGQIEDIGQVAQVAGAVKKRLEDKLGVTLTRVSVAAAGRALKTCRGAASVQLPAKLPITAQTAFSIQNEAVDQARKALKAQRGDAPYFCVGHSVVRTLLDGYPFTTALGHRASVAEVEVIATFLPAEVVDSLRRCTEQLGLEIDTLTLEPIAAMRAVIPQDIRLLNLALVDVGAGTADIALSAENTVLGYTMATVAGDEVSEAIIRGLLVDFQTAERLKLAVESNGPFTYTDILGNEKQTGLQELLQTLAPAVEVLARLIADRILECNGGPPAAVFMVGGGSKTPGLAAKLAEYLGLAQELVATAATRFSGRLLNADSGLDDPEYATPVGLALTAADNAELQGASVTVNGRRVRLFGPGPVSLTDALLMGGYTYSDLMGRNGRGLTFTLNGEKKGVRGGAYTVAELSVNGRPAGPTTPVNDGDAIGLVKAESGADAQALVGDFVKLPPAGWVAVNGRLAEAARPIADGDAITFGDGPAPAFAPDEPAEPANEPAEPASEPPPKPPAPLRSLRMLLNGKTVVLPPKPGGQPYRLFDMLALADIDPANPKGAVRLLVNGQNAAYTEPLASGDAVEVGWQEG